MYRPELSKPVVWGCQERFMREPVDGLLREATGKLGKKSLQAEMAQPIIDLAGAPRPGIATHRIARMPEEPAGGGLQSAQSILETNRLAPHRRASQQHSPLIADGFEPNGFTSFCWLRPSTHLCVPQT
jgi:hypothetical protein